MPLCTIETNVLAQNVPADFHLKLAKALSEILNKPIDRISVTISPGLLLSRGGTAEITATVRIWSINVFNKEANPVFGQKLMDFFVKEWPEIPQNRLVFSFLPVEPHEVYIKT